MAGVQRAVGGAGEREQRRQKPDDKNLESPGEQYGLHCLEGFQQEMNAIRFLHYSTFKSRLIIRFYIYDFLIVHIV